MIQMFKGYESQQDTTTLYFMVTCHINFSHTSSFYLVSSYKEHAETQLTCQTQVI